MPQNKQADKSKIDKVESTSDTMTSRAGLSLFVRYLENIGILVYLVTLFGAVRKSRKGLAVEEVFKQLFCFFLDGTSSSLSTFDDLKEDQGYAGAIESRKEDLLSRASVTRFFEGFSWFRIWLFRLLLQRLFLWLLRLAQPKVIELGMDTMVMDNDQARKRPRVEPPCNMVRGFQPLQMTWSRFIVEAVFRGGSKHSNHSDTVDKMVRHRVQKIRRGYRKDEAIVVRVDAGFFDQKLFEVFEQLQVGYICSGRIYKDVME